jgi:hypothetical protein
VRTAQVSYSRHKPLQPQPSPAPISFLQNISESVPSFFHRSDFFGDVDEKQCEASLQCRTDLALSILRWWTRNAKHRSLVALIWHSWRIGLMCYNIPCLTKTLGSSILRFGRLGDSVTIDQNKVIVKITLRWGSFQD